MSLTAIKQNEPAAEAAGIDTLAWKMRAIMLSGAVAAAAGGLYAVVLLVVTPDSVFGVLTSAQALIVALFGGVGTLWGPLIGAAILIPLSETLQAQLGDVIPGIQGVVYGIAMILVVLLAPEGIFWRVRDRFQRPSAGGAVAMIPVALPIVAAAPGPATPRNRKPILAVSGISKSFGGLQAVANGRFEVSDGGGVGVIGPDAAGEATLFKPLNGFLRAGRGEVGFARPELLVLQA